MKIIKVDIKQEVMELEPGRRDYYFYERGSEDMPPILMEENSLPSDIIHCSYSTYRLVKYYEPRTKQNTNYLIKFAENDLANTFIKIEKDMLENLIKKEVIQKLESGAYVTREFYIDEIGFVKERIKSLAWWKRLLNKF